MNRVGSGDERLRHAGAAPLGPRLHAVGVEGDPLLQRDLPQTRRAPLVRDRGVRQVSSDGRGVGHPPLVHRGLDALIVQRGRRARGGYPTSFGCLSQYEGHLGIRHDERGERRSSARWRTVRIVFAISEASRTGFST